MNDPSPQPLVALTGLMHEQAMATLKTFAAIRVADSPSPSDIVQAAAHASALIVRHRLPDDILARAPGLRVIVRHGTGLDFIPMREAFAAGVRVANVPEANVQSVAEHVIGILFMLSRRFDRQDRQVRAGTWNVRDEPRFELNGKVLGLVGFGRIARRLAPLAMALGMKVLACSRRGSYADISGVTGVTLDRLLSDSDFVSLHVPLTLETTHLIDARALALIRPTAFLVNAARGAIVDEGALLDSLRNRRLAGAALDVFGEQPVRQIHPFTALDNVILTPHSAALTEEAMLRMGLQSVEEVRRALAGEASDNTISPSASAW